MPKVVVIQKPMAPGSGSLGSPECLKINFEFCLTRSTAEGVGGFQDVPVSGSCLSCLILLHVKRPVWTASSVACHVMPGVPCHSAVSIVSTGKVMIK